MRRERLHAVIDEGHALVVIQGPSGFGKTTLVAEWVNKREPDDAVTVWMDATHSSPTTFWSDLAAAFAESGIEANGAGTSPYAAVLAAVHARSSALTLVIDRFDTVADAAIQDSLHQLILRRRGLRVIVCVRRADIFTSVLWSDLDINRIPPRDLAFTPDETRRLAQVLGVEVDADGIRALQDAGRGWPEPTRALVLEMRRESLAPSDLEAAAVRVARTYLRRRILPEFEGDDRLRFLLASSVPEEITEEIATALTGDEHAGVHLRGLEVEGMLTAIRESREVVYQWPAPARAALREELAARMPDELMVMESRLAALLYSRKDFAPALEHAMAAGDLSLAVRVIEDGWPVLLKMHVPALDRALSAIPLDLMAAHPQTAAIRDIRLHLAEQEDDFLLTLPDPLPMDPRELESLAQSDAALTAMNTATVMMIALRIRGRVGQANRYGDIVEKIGRIGRFYRPDLMASFVPNTFLQVGISRGLADDLSGAIQILRFAYELAPQSESEHVAVDSAGKLALFHAIRGDADQVTFWLGRHERSFQSSDWMTRWVELGGSIARTLAAVDRLDDADATMALTRVQLAGREEQNWSPFIVYARARYALQWGNRVGALAVVREEKLNRRAWLREGSTMRPLLDAIEAELLISLGLANQAERLLKTAPRHRALDVARSRFALLNGQPARALRIATAGLSRVGAHPSQTELLLLAARAEVRLGNRMAAARSLRHALDSAHATGTLQPMASVPHTERSDLETLVDEASEAFSRVEPFSSPFPDELRLIELTERERLILARLAGGMSVQAVADDLFVSRNTVKTQMRALYQKLDASSRDVAVARAHEYELLASPRPRSGH